MTMSGDGFGIRLAREDDYAALGPVCAEAESYHREALPHIFRRPEGAFPPLSLFRRWVSEVGSAVFVADDAGDLVGFVTVRTGSTPAEGILQARIIAVVDTLAVRSGRRRRGVGRALMTAAHG
jgi:ribosomal protein S18 acetylase RimI-like enzyme